jgi:hypothetical protein
MSKIIRLKRLLNFKLYSTLAQVFEKKVARLCDNQAINAPVQGLKFGPIATLNESEELANDALPESIRFGDLLSDCRVCVCVCGCAWFDDDGGNDGDTHEDEQEIVFFISHSVRVTTDNLSRRRFLSSSSQNHKPKPNLNQNPSQNLNRDQNPDQNNRGRPSIEIGWLAGSGRALRGFCGACGEVSRLWSVNSLDSATPRKRRFFR